MATRLRKTRKLRGGRHMGWGQVGQHRSFGHKGGLGGSGHLKHLWSTVIKEDRDHFGHESTHRPASVSIITKKWVNVRDCLLYTSPSPRDGLLSRMPSSA